MLLPYKKRPETSSLVAHNLVTGALGIKSKVTAEQRKKEREKLKEAKGIVFKERGNDIVISFLQKPNFERFFG